MITVQQKIFIKIVVHNKLMTEATVEKLLEKIPVPEDAVKFLVKKDKLTRKTAKQLLSLYGKQLKKADVESASAIRTRMAVEKAMSEGNEDDDTFDTEFEVYTPEDTGPEPDPAAKKRSPPRVQEVTEVTKRKKAPTAPAASAPAAEPEEDYGALPKIKLDMEEDDENEELPILERE